MPWTPKQKATAVRACKAHRISDEHRLLMLRQLPNAMFDRDGKLIPSHCDPTSTSKKLTNADFGKFMALVEAMTPGNQVMLMGKGGKPEKYFSPGYFQDKLDDPNHRARFKVLALTKDIEGEQSDWSLPGFIRRMTSGRTDDVHQLDRHELYKVIEGLKAIKQRSTNVALSIEVTESHEENGVRKIDRFNPVHVALTEKDIPF